MIYWKIGYFIYFVLMLVGVKIAISIIKQGWAEYSVVQKVAALLILGMTSVFTLVVEEVLLPVTIYGAQAFVKGEHETLLELIIKLF